MHYDLVIIGGGLVGASLALSLCKSPLSTDFKIALVDARIPTNTDPRLFALNYASCEFLKSLELWQQLEPHAAPIHNVHVSYQGHFGAVRLNRKAVALPFLGHVIPAYQIETLLNDVLAHQSARNTHLTIYRPAELIQLEQKNNKAFLKIVCEDANSNQTIMIETPLVIGADGAASTVRTQSSISQKTVDYQQSAIVTRTQLQRAHHHIAYERFYAQGAIAMLPLINRECATIWTLDKKSADELMQLSDSEFLSVLQKEFGYRLGKLLSIKTRHMFPLKMVRAEKMVDQCVMLLGNAAHSLHPIAAQGFNLALYEVALLSKCIRQKLSCQSVLQMCDLQQVSELMQKKQATSIGVSHRLSTLFADQSLLKSITLPMGMLGLDIIEPLKKKFVNTMAGRA